MSKYIDSNEARRLARLKQVRSSIGGTMTQHSGWQRQQIEKRRKEQLKQRKLQAKKKPIGEGIQIDTSIPVDYTTTGLKLKLDNLQSAGQVKVVGKPAKSNQQIKSVVLPINPVRRTKQQHSSSATTATNAQSVKKAVGFKDKLNALSLSSTTNSNHPAKRRSFIPKLTAGQTHVSKSRFQSDEGKENGDDQPSVQSTFRTSYLKQPGPKKHFQLATDITSLKREHADALQMLQDLDKEENRRRSLGSANSSAHSFNSSETSECDIFDKANRGQDKMFNDESFQVSKFQDDYREFVSSSSDSKSFNDDKAQSQPAGSGASLDDSFGLPEGIKDAIHLSIVLNDEIEAQEDVEYNDIQSNIGGGTPSEIESQGAALENASLADSYDYDGESGSSQEDEYLSDTSGY